MTVCWYRYLLNEHDHCNSMPDSNIHGVDLFLPKRTLALNKYQATALQSHAQGQLASSSEKCLVESSGPSGGHRSPEFESELMMIFSRVLSAETLNEPTLPSQFWYPMTASYSN